MSGRLWTPSMLFGGAYLLLLHGEIAAAKTPQGKTPEAMGRWVFAVQDQQDNGYTNSSVEITMVLVSAAGEKSGRRFTFSSLEVKGDGDKTLIIFEHPPLIKGTSLLSYEHLGRQDDQWLYLPALERVKRIAAADKSGSFVGSEFAYEDLTYDYPEKYEHRYLREEAVDGRASWVVERKPKDPDSGYSSILSFVDQQNHQTLKQHYLDRAGRPLKIQIIHGHTLHLGKHWRPTELIMQNVQTKRQTILKMDNWKLKQSVNPNRFSRHTLGR